MKSALLVATANQCKRGPIVPFIKTLLKKLTDIKREKKICLREKRDNRS